MDNSERSRDSVAKRAASLLIYANAFLVGGVLMGFEMLGADICFPILVAGWALGLG